MGILATLAVDESVLNYAEKQGLLALGDEIMEVQNRRGFEPKRWRKRRPKHALHDLRPELQEPHPRLPAPSARLLRRGRGAHYCNGYPSTAIRNIRED
ncbi:MAG: hypothetical protein WCA32_22325, partial [Chromatiaceae bacterium]